MQQTVAKAAGEHLRQATEAAGATAEAPGPCDVAVLFALGEESAGLEDLLENAVALSAAGLAVRLGVIGARRVAVARTGAGRARAAAATEAILDGHKPKLVISAGFAGGLAKELHRGDLLLADSVCLEKGEPMPLDLAAVPATLRDWPRLSVGRALTLDRVVRTPEEKQAMGAKFTAQAAEMETYAVAEVCRRRETPFLGVRVILDPADERLPPEVENLLDQRSAAGRAGAALGAIFNRPSSVKDLYRLKENALIASDHLAKFLAVLIAS